MDTNKNYLDGNLTQIYNKMEKNKMPEIEHDWDKIPKYKHKYELYDKFVMLMILGILAFCSVSLFIAVINNPRFCM